MYIMNVWNKKGGVYMNYIRKTFNIPEGIASAIEEYRKENVITTFTGAMLELIRKGLDK